MDDKNIEKYFEIVTNNPSAFDTWTYLLQLIEQKNDIEQIRKIYDIFLTDYPFCYVYWEKYASFENNFGFINRALDIYDKAIQEVRYSVDMWIYYINFLIQQNIKEDIIRRVFEEGAESVGLDYGSGSFWEKWIEFEQGRGNNMKVNEILARVLRIPLHGLASFYDKFFNRLFERPFSEFVESEKIMEGIQLENTTPEQQKKDFLNKYESLFKISQKKMEEIKKYEDLISTRYYFHFKEQSIDHLQNWHSYLDFILSQNDPPRIISTFERCLIACANYEEFFIRYSEYLESVQLIESGYKLLKRATNVFFKNKPTIHLYFANFCEQYQLEDVSNIYKNLFKNERILLHLDSVLSHILFQKRKGNLQLVKHLYSSSLSLFKSYSSNSSSSPSSSSSNSSNSSSSSSSSSSVHPPPSSLLDESNSSLPSSEGNTNTNNTTNTPNNTNTNNNNTNNNTTISTNNSNNNNNNNGVGNVNKKGFVEELNYLLIHYSNFLIKTCNSPNDAKKLFEEYLPSSSSLSLFLTFLNFLSFFSENDEDYNRILKEVYESDIFRNNKLSEIDRMKFQYNFLTYVRDNSNDISFYRKVEKEFRTSFPTFRSSALVNTKKRLIDDGNFNSKKLKLTGTELKPNSMSILDSK